MKKIVLSEFIERSNEIHKNKYDYSLVDFKNNDSMVNIICPNHGIFKQRVGSHLSGKSCNSCKFDNRRTPVLKFIEKSSKIHNNKYDYSMVDYSTTNNKVKIICPNHGIFEKSPKNHLNGQGCPLCKKITTDKFIKICENKHRHKYDYSLSKYSGSHSKVKIICKDHGIFEQSASQHMRGFGCLKCSIDNRKLSTNEFIDISNKAHNNKYNYSLTEYTLSKSKVEIICPIHGKFLQFAADHMSGVGCKSCGSEISVSKLEIKWLDSLNIKSENRQYKISKYIVDGYDPLTNTIYEFNGDFWHGNPEIHNPNDINPLTNSTFGYLYQKTLSKEKSLLKRGYNVVSIWESEYKKQIY
jgi:hypothetical protein